MAVLLVACTADPYPLPGGAGQSLQSNAVRVGDPTTAVVLFLDIRPSDRIELLGADPLGSLDGATVELLFSRPVVDANGDTVVGDVAERLEGAEFSAAEQPGPGNQVGIVAVLTAQRPGRFVLSSVRLRYRLNDEPERVGEGAQVAWLVCADDPAPATCEPEDAAVSAE